MSDASGRDFDLVLFGATGYTGRLVADYLSKHREIDDIRWAIAGRNREKLERVRAELGPSASDLPILVGDCIKRDSLDDIADKARVICSTVGPYSLYGSAVVAACVDAGTDYCDLSAEFHWIREMIDEHHEKARSRGIRIVPSCGFDSIPSDLGTYLLQQESLKRHDAVCNPVRLLVWKLRGGLSGGTAASTAAIVARASEDEEIRKLMNDPLALVPETPSEWRPEPSQRSLRRDEFTGGWTGPFIMAAANEKIVHRTNALLDHRYGKRFQYSEASHFGRGPGAALRATALTAGVAGLAAGLSTAPTRKMLTRFAFPEPGEGPDAKTRESGRFELRIFGRGIDQDGSPFEQQVTVSADSDPGYGATSIMLGESALSLAIDEQPGELDGGVLSPATALGMPLIERLRRASMVFDSH